MIQATGVCFVNYILTQKLFYLIDSKSFYLICIYISKVKWQKIYNSDSYYSWISNNLLSLATLGKATQIEMINPRLERENLRVWEEDFEKQEYNKRRVDMTRSGF